MLPKLIVYFANLVFASSGIFILSELFSGNYLELAMPITAMALAGLTSLIVLETEGGTKWD